MVKLSDLSGDSPISRYMGNTPRFTTGRGILARCVACLEVHLRGDPFKDITPTGREGRKLMACDTLHRDPPQLHKHDAIWLVTSGNVRLPFDRIGRDVRLNVQLGTRYGFTRERTLTL